MRTDHHPDSPSHTTPRVRDLRERLDSATDEGPLAYKFYDGSTGGLNEPQFRVRRPADDNRGMIPS